MDRRLFLATIGAVAASSPALAEQQTLRAKMIGLWSLKDAVSIVGTEVSPWFGRRTPISGLLSYHDSGTMSVQITGSTPDDVTRDGFNKLPDADKFQLIKEYYAYYGTFDVDESTRTVVHHVSNASLPYEKKASLKRQVELDQDTMTILTAPRDDNGKSTFNRLVWTRQA